MTPFRENNRVLYVDDEPYLLDAFASMLRKDPFQVTTISTPTSVEDVLRREGPFAMVLSDQRMPGMDGVAVLELVGRMNPDTIRVLITGFSDHTDTVRAINAGGIRHYIQKPWDDLVIRSIIREGVSTYNLERQNVYLLEELQRKNEAIKELLQGTIAGATRVLAEMVAHVNADAAAQVERVRRLGKSLLTRIPDLGSTERWEALRAFDLFNLGITVLPAWILVVLNKHGLNSIERFPIARTHHLQAADMLVKIPRFEGVARVIRLQRKDFDGNGEPAGDVVHGRELPLGSRMLRILVDLDMLSSKHYKGRAVLEQMARLPEKYDMSILRLLLEDNSEVVGKKDILVESVIQLREGMQILDDLKNKGGQVLLRRGMILTGSTLEMLARCATNDGIVFPVRARQVG